jgi:hypothetical protein
MLLIDYLRALAKLNGRPRRDPDFRLGVVTTVEATIVQAFVTVWAIRATELPHDVGTLISAWSFFAMVGIFFAVSWGALLKMLTRELRPLVYFAGSRK